MCPYLLGASLWTTVRYSWHLIDKMHHHWKRELLWGRRGESVEDLFTPIPGNFVSFHSIIIFCNFDCRSFLASFTVLGRSRIIFRLIFHSWDVSLVPLMDAFSIVDIISPPSVYTPLQKERGKSPRIQLCHDPPREGLSKLGNGTFRLWFYTLLYAALWSRNRSAPTAVSFPSTAQQNHEKTTERILLLNEDEMESPFLALLIKIRRNGIF